ncbi:exosortase C-terminal domain/associated protein EpsI [Desulfopila sp. IMCC35006]|uniref:exosortase C-terminal domain/associated protein EpsI n=1 Tax=Desulfopila sp. IMCC35006 TaxID=2569542 RepID=UPI00142EFAD7|nr:exosortase C-terminal domain/associated protein EpsI [Desulfopila sp. IMCC35006]
MGQTSTKQVITVIIIFFLTGVFVYSKSEPVRSVKKRTLNQALAEVGGWKAGPRIAYGKEIVDSLALDDYLNRTFTKGDKSVNLYIGYYLNSEKVGAAHDPLVCFPGQGWNVSDREKGNIEIGDGVEQKVSFSTMIVEQGAENKSMILYWFQAYESANSDTFSQKINGMLQKISGGGEDNAFVRLICDVNKKSESECMEMMQDFTKAFYPIFLKYIRE